MKKIFFILVFMCFSTVLLADKRCGCDEGGTAYKWFVKDGGNCETDANPNGKAVKQTAKIAEIVEMSEALDFCFPK